jgi:serine/threonine protein kinase
MEPRRIASYTLLEPIGHGGMAAVYRARQESLDRIVAIKVLSDNLAASDEFMQRFVREARTAANMRHPNVITVHDFGQDERGVPYLVLEYVDGPTLADLMDDGLDDSRIPDLLDQVAAGLDYAHSRGVIHRDVKPGNVLLTDDGRVVLADFGLAWLAEAAIHLTMSGGVIGTPEYMSPEQASGLRVDARTDVYALGVVLYEMLTGDRPYTSDSPIAILLKHVQAPVPSVAALRPDLPAAIDRVVQQALAKDPEHRFQTASALARAFREAIRPGRAEASSGGSRGAQRTPVAEGADEPQGVQDRSAGADRRWTSPESQPDGRPCPGCGATLPLDAGICPSCMYMIPLDQLPRAERPKKIERREVVLNLLPRNLRWTPAGLAEARQLAGEALQQATTDGWEPASIGEPCRLEPGKTITGSIVRSAVLRLERVA